MSTVNPPFDMTDIRDRKDYCERCKGLHTTINCPSTDGAGYRIPPSVNHSDLLALSPEEKAAHIEFREAAREARCTQEAAQKAAKRYANAVKRLSDAVAPSSETTE